MMNDRCRLCRGKIDADADHADKTLCADCYDVEVKRAAEAVRSIRFGGGRGE